MTKKTLKGVYFQIQTNPGKRSKSSAGEAADQSDVPNTTESVEEIRTLKGEELSTLINKVLGKRFKDRFIGMGDFALAGHGDTILSEMTSIPEDKDDFRFFLFTKKRSDAPTETKVENDGTIKISPIEIASGAFISESTLLVLNVKTGVILELMNRNAGTTGSFAYYLSLCNEDENPEYFEVAPVLNNQAALARLGTMSALKKLEFSLSTALIPEEQQRMGLDDLFSTVNDVANNPATRKVNVVMSASRGKSLDKSGIIKIVKKLLHLQNEKPKGILRVSGEGQSSAFDIIDFVKDEFLFLWRYEHEGKYINTGEVFEFMQKDYERRLEKIKQSIGMSPS